MSTKTYALIAVAVGAYIGYCYASKLATYPVYTQIKGLFQ
jgi:hypothetical protein